MRFPIDSRPAPGAILSAYRSLTDAQREAFDSLDFDPPDSEEEQGLNQEELDDYSASEPYILKMMLANYTANQIGGCVCTKISQLNHDCLPNCQIAWNAGIGKVTVHAVRDIAKEEELTISYIDGANMTKDSRQEKLNEWGFQCRCKACADTETGREHDAVRDTLECHQEYIKTQWEKGSAMDVDNCHRNAVEMADLQEENGILTKELADS